MDKISIIVRYVNTSTKNCVTEHWRCVDAAYNRYEFLKKIFDYVELGIEVNDNYFWLLKCGEFVENDLQD